MAYYNTIPIFVSHSYIPDGEIEAESGDFNSDHSVTESRKIIYISILLLL